MNTTRGGAGDHWDADVLVLGAGVAGLCAALAAAPRRVLLLCPDVPVHTSASALAQGGIAAPVGPDDSVDVHVGDTLEAACHSADPEAVGRVIASAADALRFLEAAGVDFDRKGAARSLHLEAGHRRARVAHAAGDRSGAAIVAALWASAENAAHVQILSGWRAVALLASRDGVAGAQLIDAAGRAGTVRARETVLATGGLGRLFRYTTNGAYATGDGLAMALAIGARTAALEFVQFHPTALRVGADPLPLLTEALRGAGAHLVTAAGRAVMAGRHALGDLAPRDIVARAVFEAAAAGENVLLDATGIFTSEAGLAFPGARQTALRFGFDPAAVPLPVTSAAHYHMGGVVVDVAGRTNVPGLWACGEVAYTGLHGANRLASNSLLEAVVCGQAVGAYLAGAVSRPRPVVVAGRTATLACAGGEGRLPALRELMWRAMGPVRDGTSLRAALAVMLAESEALAADDLVQRQRFALAATMMRAAIAREESRGAHWRSDFPRRDPSRDGPQAVYAQLPPDTGRHGLVA